MNVDVELLSDFDPFTHVYSFDKAFTPDLIGHLIKALNNSKCLNYVASYQKISDADDFDFNFLAEISTNMTGMSIVSIFFYKRKTLRKLSNGPQFNKSFEFLSNIFYRRRIYLMKLCDCIIKAS